MSVNRSPINSPIQSPVGSPLRPGGAPEPGTPPNAPTLNTVTPTNYHTNQIAFTPAGTGEPATSFRLLRSDTPGGPYTAIGGGAASPLDDKDAPVEATSYYVVQARANYANSPNSNEGSGTTPAAPAYAVPTNVDPKAISDTVIEVSWDDITPLADEDRVDIYRGGVKIATVVGLDQKPYADTGLTPNTTYTYELTAGSQWAQGAKSTAADGTTFGPPAAPDLSLDSSAQPWELSWTTVAGADTYRLYESSEPDPINTGTVVYEGVLTFATRNVPRPRYWVVTAGNAYGWGDASNSVNTENPWAASEDSALFALAGNATGSNAAAFVKTDGNYLSSAVTAGTAPFIAAIRFKRTAGGAANTGYFATNDRSWMIWNDTGARASVQAKNGAAGAINLVGSTYSDEEWKTAVAWWSSDVLYMRIDGVESSVACVGRTNASVNCSIGQYGGAATVCDGACADALYQEFADESAFNAVFSDFIQRFEYEQQSAADIQAAIGGFQVAANLTERQSTRQNDGSGANFAEVGGPVGAGPGPKRVYTVATDIGDPLSSPNVGTLEGATDWLRIAPGTLPGDPAWALKCRGSASYADNIKVADPGGGPGYTLGGWVKSAINGNTVMMGYGYNGSSSGHRIRTLVAGGIQWQCWMNSAGTTAQLPGIPEQWQFVCMRAVTGGTIDIFVDDQKDIGSGLASISESLVDPEFVFGTDPNGKTTVPNAELSQWRCYNRGLTDQEVEDWRLNNTVFANEVFGNGGYRLDEGPADTETTFDVTGSAIDLLINTGTELGANAPLLDLSQDSAVGRPYGGRDGNTNRTLSFEGSQQYMRVADDAVPPLDQMVQGAIITTAEWTAGSNAGVWSTSRNGSTGQTYMLRNSSGTIAISMVTTLATTTEVVPLNQVATVTVGWDGSKLFVRLDQVELTLSAVGTGWLSLLAGGNVFSIGALLSNGTPGTFAVMQLSAMTMIDGTGLDWETQVKPVIESQEAEQIANLH